MKETITLRIDGSTLNRYMQCPRSYHYYHNLKRESTGWRSGLEFGKLIHECLALRYKNPDGVITRKDGTVWSVDFAQQHIIEEFYKTAQFAPDDYRTQDYAHEVLIKYNAQYPYEPFELLKPTEAHCELAFEHELGEFYYPLTDKTVRVLWTGRIDIIAEFAGSSLWEMDHKTSSIGGPTYFDEYHNNTSQIGYCWATQLITKRPVDGFIINAIFLRKQTANGKGITFERQRFPVSQERIEEWRTNTMQWIIRAYNDALYPQATTQCCAKFGKCEYLDVCQLTESSRLPVLSSNLYKDVTWSPTNAD